MFSSMVDTWSVALALSAVVMVVALLAEGRGRHLARLILGLRPSSTLDDIMAEVPRDENDWDLVEEVHSVPDRAAPGERALQWATDATSKATKVVVERASAITQPGEDREGPRTSELGLAQR